MCHYPLDFDASGSSDADGQVVSYSWDFGDGSPTAAGATVSHTFTEPGLYTVQLTVTDDENATSSLTRNVDARGADLSGTVQILSTSARDSDVNDRLTTPVSNNGISTAQLVPNPVQLGGFINLPGTGDASGNLFATGDPADFYAITLAGNELIVLSIGEADADLDLHLRDATGAIVDFSVSLQQTESLTAPGPGRLFHRSFSGKRGSPTWPGPATTY